MEENPRMKSEREWWLGTAGTPIPPERERDAKKKITVSAFNDGLVVNGCRND